MNEDYENKGAENEEAPKNETSREEPKESEPKKKKRVKNIGAATLICFAVFVLLYAIVNLSGLAATASAVISVLSPIILGAGLAYLLNPILKFFEFKIFKRIKNKKLLRVLSLICTYVTAIGFLTAFVFLVAPQLLESISSLLDRDTLNGYIDNTVNTINGFINKYLNTHTEIKVNREQLLAVVAKFFSNSGDLFQGIGELALEYLGGLVVGIKNSIFALFISIYILISKERLKAQANKITTAFFRPEAKKKFYKYVTLCNRTFNGFFIGKIVDSLIIGLITLVVLFFFKMPYYLLVSAIVCVTNIIPVFGPFIGAIPSFFIILIVDPSKALLFVLIILLIQQLDGNVIGPKILGNSTGMSSLGVIVSIIIMGDLFGVVGMILGVPIFAVALAIVNELSEDRLRKKNLPVNTAEYYPPDSLVDPYEKKETLSHWLFSATGNLFGKLFRLIFKKNKKADSNSDLETNKNSDSETDSEKEEKDNGDEQRGQ